MLKENSKSFGQIIFFSSKGETIVLISNIGM